ncbi:MAG TPA: class I SAM-dependent methyltransferase [Chloroflexota bacterium]|nr:class I SAM-dependent methyltransferase [Chloroflexota bacterium]
MGRTVDLNARRVRAAALVACKRTLSRWPPAMVAALLVNNGAWLVRLRLGLIETEMGATHAKLAVEDSVRYAESVLAGYKERGQVDAFHGRVAEVGPGDSAGVALLLRHDGATQVDLVDRFRRKPIDAGGTLLEALDRRHGLAALRCGDQWSNDAVSAVDWKVGQPAETYFRHCPPETYDFIVSWAVMEHLYDPIGAVRDMVRCLRPGGRMLHTIDLTDHDLFSSRGEELAWLRYPRWLWRLMTSHSGHPNRVLAHQYRRELDELVHEGKITYNLLVTLMVGVGRISPWREFDDIPVPERDVGMARADSVRPGLSQEFREAAAADLAIRGLFLLVHKPAGAASDGQHAQSL